MYQAHFGLSRPLFDSGIAQDAAVYLTPKHERFVANAKVALSTFESGLLVTGPAGVGKTTLITSALRATSTRLALGWITAPPAHAGELLELLLAEFGFDAHRAGRVERMQLWRQFLNEMRATESRVFVIADRADDLSHDVLRALDSLTAADPGGSPGANIALLGQPGLVDHLKQPSLDSLRQRIRLRERVEPLSADELRSYLALQAARAGSDLDKLFAGDAIVTLHVLCGGLPRVANNLCETALGVAAAANEGPLTTELLLRIADTMFGIELPAAADAPTAQVPAAEALTAEAPAAQVPAADAPTPKAAEAPAAEVPAAELDVPVPAAAVAAAGAARTDAPAEAAEAADADDPVVAPAADADPTVAHAIVAPPSVALTFASAASATFAATPPAFAATTWIEPNLAAPAAHAANAVETIAAPPHAAAPRDEVEIDSFADTITDMPEVPMPDLPVLTDAVELPPRAARMPPRDEIRDTHAAAIDTPAQTAEPVASIGPFAAPEVFELAETPEPIEPGAPVELDAVEPIDSVASADTVQPIDTVEPVGVVEPVSALLSAIEAADPIEPIAAFDTGEPVIGTAAPAANTYDLSAPGDSPVVADDTDHGTQTARALASAESLAELEDPVAEALFGDSDFDMLSAALRSAGWSDEPTMPQLPVAALPERAAPKPAPEPKRAPSPEPSVSLEEDPFAFFGLGPDAPLELIDDSAPPNEPGHRAVGNR